MEKLKQNKILKLNMSFQTKYIVYKRKGYLKIIDVFFGSLHTFLFSFPLKRLNYKLLLEKIELPKYPVVQVVIVIVFIIDYHHHLLVLFQLLKKKKKKKKTSKIHRFSTKTTTIQKTLHNNILLTI